MTSPRSCGQWGVPPSIAPLPIGRIAAAVGLLPEELRLHGDRSGPTVPFHSVPCFGVIRAREGGRAGMAQYLFHARVRGGGPPASS